MKNFLHWFGIHDWIYLGQDYRTCSSCNKSQKCIHDRKVFYWVNV
jgi:hypothetical protein